ncbi:MAG: FG-GAP and VCBS repeat-containing protein [Candidatus Acidiferrales bacterium]
MNWRAQIGRKSRNASQQRTGFLAALLLAASTFATVTHAQSAGSVLLQASNIYNGDPNMVPLGVATGDFNGDGYLDFVVAEHSLNSAVSDQLAFYMGNSDGSFTETAIVPVNGTIAGQLYATNHIIGSGHFNGPGEPFGVAVALTTSTDCGTGGPGVFMLYGQPGGSSIALCVPTTTAPTSIAVADFNNDGFDDWAISNPSGAAAGTMTVYLNIANPAAGESGFYFYGNYSATGTNFSGTLYGTIVAGNLGPQENGPSIALLASSGPFSQFVDVFENFEPLAHGVAALTFSVPDAAVNTGNSLSDIAIGNVDGSGTAAVIGIGVGTLSYIPVTDISGGQARPLLGVQTHLPAAASGVALALGTFDENIYSDVAFLGTNRNLGINLDPGFSHSILITPFGAAGQNVATGFSTSLNKWLVVDAGIYQQQNPSSFVQIPEARSIAVYLVDPTTGFPAQPSIFSPATTSSQGILPAFAVGDFNGDGLPDVAVLGLDNINFGATWYFPRTTAFTSCSIRSRIPARSPIVAPSRSTRAPIKSSTPP